jgi:(p)ppGpp synthase/HD superfamily hydrolase
MQELTQLLEKLATYDTSEDGRILVEHAAQFAEACHAGFSRLDESSYILHPIAVATILSEWQASPEILAAALLHDVFNKRYSQAPSLTDLEANFPPPLSLLVRDVASLSEFGQALYQASISAERVEESTTNSDEQLSSDLWDVTPFSWEIQENNLNSGSRPSWAVVVLQRNPMAVVIKIADRLHNLRTHDALPEAVRRKEGRRFATAILNIFAPFADRLGMWRVKQELEDGAFHIQNDEQFTELEHYVHEVLADVPIDEHVSNLQRVLHRHGMNVKVVKQLNHLYKIYRQRFTHKDRTVLPTDIFSVVVVASKEDCYRALGVVHSTWRPLGEVYDNLTTPRPNGYRALNTRVHEPSLGEFKVLIRTEAMHLVAEHGITARWRGISEELLPTIDPLPERPAGYIMAITPQGEVKYLPQGATSIDFAYAINPEMGHHCTQAWVNGSQAPLEAPLEDGSVVDIIVSRGVAEPNRAWLDFVVTETAREAIEKWRWQHLDTELVIEGADRVGLVKDVVSIISDRGINILYLYAEVPTGSRASIRIGLHQIRKGELENLERDINDLPQITQTRRRPLSASIEEARPHSLPSSARGNPYSLDPVAGSDFKGRERDVKEIVNRLRGRDHDSTLLIWGQQRIGKTSLLCHLEQDVLPSKTYLIVNVTLHDVVHQPISHFLHHIVRKIEQKLQKEEIKAPPLSKMKRYPLFPRFSRSY